ncbi:hypothetical protein WJX84_004131 [Apatococcus fuscideae]|uniref:Uncharacterized protein n=1 Tax=Apatococcus fuscideae TaxID=2026836 RepID=A0AAW1SRD6_9CHLO
MYLSSRPPNSCQTCCTVPVRSPQRLSPSRCRGISRKPVFAQSSNSDGPDSSEAEAEREQRLATLEKRGRRRDMMPQPTRQPQQTQPEKGGPAEWKEGKWLPEGWDKMDPPQKVYEIYTGKRGLLFWASKLSYASLFILGAAGLLDNLFGNKGKSCSKCKGEGAIKCPGCQGTGRNKKNGNMFERWKCYDCQGFGLVTCPNCGGGEGLTPEQRRER